MQPFYIRLDDDLYEDVKLAAALREEYMSTFVRQALHDWSSAVLQEEGRQPAYQPKEK